MDRHEDPALNHDVDSTAGDGEHHATTGGAAAAGAATGAVVGLAGGPVGAAIGAVGGAIVGAAAERMMHSDDDAERAREGYGNDHDGNPLIEDRAETDTLSTNRPDYETAAGRNPGAVGPANADRMQLREEELHARTTPVQTGQVSVGKNVVEERRTMDVPVSREEVFVERQPVDRRPSDQPIGESSRSIDMPVHEEQVTMEKTPVVYEEVGVGKREVTETRNVSGTVRREEAHIENEGDVNVRKNDF